MYKPHFAADSVQHYSEHANSHCSHLEELSQRIINIEYNNRKFRNFQVQKTATTKRKERYVASEIGELMMASNHQNQHHSKLQAMGRKAGRNGAEIADVASFGELGYEILRPLSYEETNPSSQATLSLDDNNPKVLLFGKHKLNFSRSFSRSNRRRRRTMTQKQTKKKKKNDDLGANEEEEA